MGYQRIVITGFMGTGKTKVGQRVASGLQWHFFDTDQLTEALENSGVSKIFDEKGEEYFRALESRCLENLVTMSEVVIATGGGTLLNPKNLALAQAGSLLVCLRTSEEELWKRLSKDKTRPLLKRGFSSLSQLLKEREPIYKTMGYSLDTTGKTPEKVSQEILELFGGKLLSQ